MDLADQIDDYICSFEGLGDLSMDSLAIFIFIWAVLALFSVWLCKFLYQKYLLNKNNATSTTATKTTTPSASSSRAGSVAPGKPGDKQRLSEPREVGAAKMDLKDLLTGKGGGGGGGGGGGRGRAMTPSSAPVGGMAGGAGQLRRRVVRQSSAGPENRRKRYVPPPSNVVGPETTTVTWTSQVFRWLYSDLVIVNELLVSWVIALNDTLKKSLEEHGVAVEIVRVLPDSPPPALNNIFCNCDEFNPADMIITFDADAMPVLQVKTFRQRAGKVETSHYKVTVSRFRARMAVPINYNTLKGEMRVEGYPDVRIAMNSVGQIKPMDQDETQLQSVISEILTMALKDTVYPVDFSTYATCPRAEPEQLDIPVIYPVHYDSMAHNMEGLNAAGQQYGAGASAATMSSGRRLLVKIVKGDGMKDARDPFVVVEMDEPPQKNQTGSKQGHNPYWDEHFLFELTLQSAEILFEVYDRPLNANDAPKFIGLGLVGIDELAGGPASTQVLTLQPRPYETQPVSGSITVDFVFIEGADLPVSPRPYKLKEALRISTPAINEHIKNGSDLADAAVRALQEGALSTANGQPSKSTLIIHSVQRVELNKDGKIEVTENATTTTNTTTSTSTTTPNGELNVAVTKAFESALNPTKDVVELQQQQSQQQQHIDSVLTDLTASSPSDSHTTTTGDAQILDSTASTATAGGGGSGAGNANALESTVLEFGQPNAASSPQGHLQHPYNGTNNSSGYNSLQRNGATQLNASNNYQYNNNNNLTGTLDSDITSATMDDSRGRSKKRNFFGTLKKRLGRSKPRTHSVDRDVAVTHTSSSSSAINHQSAYNNGTTPTGTLNGDSSRSLSVDRGVLSKRNSFGNRMGGGGTLDHSRRSSISESSAISGFSSSSNKTYVHEASTLVLETIENGIKRHFVVPLAIAQRPRWRRKGTKLHIYNDHTFIAKHLSGSGLQCMICMKSIPRRPGKQGYECRDCQMVCHKQCHVRAPQACPNPTVLSMEMTRLNSSAADRSIRKR